MLFEEILPLMRKGAKAQMKSVDDGSYWICCKQYLLDIKETEQLSIALLNKEGKFINNGSAWGIPRWAAMADNWEIVE